MREREKKRERERERREREKERERVQSMMLSIGKECLAYHSFALANMTSPFQKHFFAKKSNKQILRKKKTIFILQPFVVSRCRQ